MHEIQMFLIGLGNVTLNDANFPSLVHTSSVHVIYVNLLSAPKPCAPCGPCGLRVLMMRRFFRPFRRNQSIDTGEEMRLTRKCHNSEKITLGLVGYVL